MAATQSPAERERSIAILLFAAMLSGFALLLHAGIISRLGSEPTPIAAWLLIAAGFGLAEIFAVHVEIKQDAHSFSMTELPLVIGLFVIAPQDLVLARLLGGLIAIGVIRRQAIIKLLFNGSLFALETALAVCVFYVVRGAIDHDFTASTVGAAAATIAGNLMSSAAISKVISLAGGEPPRGTMMKMAALGTYTALGTTSLALMAVTVVQAEPLALLLVLMVGLVLFGAYQSYARIHQRYSALQYLYEFTKMLSRSPEVQSSVTATLEQAVRLLRAERVDIFMLEDDGERGVRVSLDGQIETTSELLADDPLRARVVAEGQSMLVTRATKRMAEQRYLEARGIKDAVIAPLTRAGEGGSLTPLGSISAYNRLGDVSTFSDHDAKVLETIANHASISLVNAQLLDRLRLEAAERAHEAIHDALTGLGNRRMFTERTERALRSVREDGGRVGVMLLDLDRFKDVNDSLGHANGDILLQEIARRLLQTVPVEATVARLGGDEFVVVLLDQTGQVDFMSVARELRDALSEPLCIGSLDLVVGATIGVAIAPEHGIDAATLLQRADIAMYEAKAMSEDRIRLYSAQREQVSARRLELAVDLREAVSEDRIEVVFQPKAALGTGRIVGAEALARWNHPRYGYVNPEEFVAIAENVGLIGPFTESVLRRALVQVSRWHEEGFDLSVSVNVSARNLLDVSLPSRVAQLLESCNVPASSLTLEITESEMMSDPKRTLDTLHQLSNTGLTLSIDDFGTGYSSLSYLQRLPVRELKIDKAFVLGLPDNDSNGAIVRSTIELAKNLGLRIVAEGVEDRATWDELSRLGCDMAQGYFINRPIAAVEFLAWLRASHGHVMMAHGEGKHLRSVTTGKH